MRMEIKVPVSKFAGVKEQIERTWFISDEPLFTWHRQLQPHEYESATFEANELADMKYIKDILPEGSFYSPVIVTI
jgi:hypothetical protein